MIPKILNFEEMVSLYIKILKKIILLIIFSFIIGSASFKRY